MVGVTPSLPFQALRKTESQINEAIVLINSTRSLRLVRIKQIILNSYFIEGGILCSELRKRTGFRTQLSGTEK